MTFTANRAGDKAIIEISHRIRECTRQIDLAARYGGDEFAIILPSTGLDEAMIVCQRIVDAVAVRRFIGSRNRSPCRSASASASTARTQSEDITSRSDQALYVAKHSGKNTVRAFEPVAHSSRE